jgi:hypothetical protein
MIAVLPQTGQRHRNVNGEAGAAQSQLESGCFIGATLLLGKAAANALAHLLSDTRLDYLTI